MKAATAAVKNLGRAAIVPKKIAAECVCAATPRKRGGIAVAQTLTSKIATTI